MIRAFFTVMFYFIIPIRLFSQVDDLLVHFNNFQDEETMSADARAQVNIDAFRTVVTESGNPATEIQIVFYDPKALGYYVLKEAVPLNVEGYMQRWKEAHNDKNRILFLFNKTNGKYTFAKLVASPNVSAGQLPEVVCSYIAEKIIMILATTYQEAIQQGINAILNAYNPKYKNTLVSVGTEMLSFPKYFKGHCYPTQLLYYNDFESFDIEKTVLYQFTYNETHTIWNEELPVEYLSAGASPSNYLSQPYFFNGPFEGMTTLSYLSRQNGLFFGYTDKTVFGSGSKHIRLNTVTGSSFNPLPASSLFYYHNDNVQRTLATPLAKEEYIELYDTESGRNVTLISTKSEFDMYSDNAYNATVNKINQAFSSADHHSTDHPKYSFCRLKLSLYRVRSGEQLPEGAVDLYYGGDNPTWCNTFARDLLEDIFGYEVLPYKGANVMSNFLSNNSGTDFIEVSLVSNASLAWDLVKRGYIVVFSYFNPEGPGHIELGYPNQEGQWMTIGAGRETALKYWKPPFNTAIKSFGSSQIQNVTKAYVYLSHLVVQYEN